MKFTDTAPATHDTLDRLFHTFLYKLIDVAKFMPREQYLYPIMRGVPFRDLDVALDLAIIEHRKANDNNPA